MERFELVYKINKNEQQLRILGDRFFRRNKYNGKILDKNRLYPLKDILTIKNVKECTIKINIIFNKMIYNKSFMFDNCYSLLKFSLYEKDGGGPIISNYTKRNEKKDENTEIGNISEETINGEKQNLFDSLNSSFNSENSLYDIYSFDSIENDFSKISSKEDNETSFTLMSNKKNKYNNDINLMGMFQNCNSLISLTGIENLGKNGKITNLSGIFSGCSNLISLPDISVWNTENVKDMRQIFSRCSNLISIPDTIS